MPAEHAQGSRFDLAQQQGDDNDRGLTVTRGEAVFSRATWLSGNGSFCCWFFFPEF